MAKDARPARAATGRARRPAAPKQAVIVIHGMGEQRPMETLRAFVHAVWSTDLSLTDRIVTGRRTTDPETGATINKSWIVPDRRAASHELRRITTPVDVNGRRTDFYELYWADITQETKLVRLLAWVQGLLLRKPSDIPRDALKLYLAAWIAVLVAVAPTAVLWLMQAFGAESWLLPAAAWSLLGLLVLGVLFWFVIPYFGDVAAYARAEASTVAARQSMRERGLELIEPLMEDPEYDRIVLVSHSLGTIIAYDLLQILWAKYGPNRQNPRREEEVLAALRKVGRFSAPLSSAERDRFTLTPEERRAFRAAQWETYAALRSVKDGSALPWKISDFVTFGSPLTHAEFLVARNARAFRRAMEERLFAACPPLSEKKRPTILYTDRRGDRHAHHAAVFAATRWTNVFDTGNRWCTGDPFSGPMTENFGPGVEEVRVRLSWKLLGMPTRLFTHTSYWSEEAEGRKILPSGEPGERSHIDVLRDAVDLARAAERAPPKPKATRTAAPAPF